MENENLLSKMNLIKNNLEDVRKKLNSAREILNDSITFNNEGFREEKILNLCEKIKYQIDSIDNDLIPKINNM